MTSISALCCYKMNRTNTMRNTASACNGQHNVIVVTCNLQNMMHRDIKPENLLLSEEYEVKLADFGLAINIDLQAPLSRVGTLDYMAPEVDCFVSLPPTPFAPPCCPPLESPLSPLYPPAAPPPLSPCCPPLLESRLSLQPRLSWPSDLPTFGVCPPAFNMHMHVLSCICKSVCASVCSFSIQAGVLELAALRNVSLWAQQLYVTSHPDPQSVCIQGQELGA